MTNNFEALPVEVAQSALSPSKMKVLNVLYRYNSLDTTAESGYFYISNETLKSEAEISDSKKTFYDVISFFTDNHFITRQSGSRTKEDGAVASTYILHKDVILEWAIAHPKKGKGTPSMGTLSKGTPKKSKCTDEVAELRLRVERLERENTQFRKEFAELRALLMGTPMGTPMGTLSMGTPMEEKRDWCTPELKTEIEKTNHIVTGSNTIENDNYRDDAGATFNKVEGNCPDEVAPSNEVDQTGDVCDFNKKSKEGVDTFQPDEKNTEQGEIINPNGMTTPDDEQINNPNGEVTQSQPDEQINKSQATANKASGSLAIPQMVQDTTNEREHAQIANKVANPAYGNVTLNAEERLKQLDSLQLWKMQTPNVNPIELAKELGEILTNELYQSRTYSKAVEIGCYLTKYANDIDTLNQIEKSLTEGHIGKYSTSIPTVAFVYDEARKELANPQTLETSKNAHQSLADTSDEETIIQSDKSREIANKAANPASGNTDTNPQDENTPQTSENKASGSVSAPQMGKLSTDTDKRAQNAPESPTMAMEQDDTINNDILQLRKANKMYRNNDENASRLADKTANHIIRYIPKIDTVGKINWCRCYINRAFEQWGWVLESSAAFYLDHINKKLDEREAQLLAA